MSLDRMLQLIDIINYHNTKYYVMDNPEISDAEYDVLYDELRALELVHGVRANSPTQRVGGEPIKAFGTHRHLERLYSLDKVKSLDSLKKWASKIEAKFKVKYTVDYKLDGLTICATYEGGAFKRATTRGNGLIGEDVSVQAKTIRTLPLSIPYGGIVEVQGEAVMRLSVFEEYNKMAIVPLKNARNGVAGAIRNLDPRVTAERKVDIYFYNVNYIDLPLNSQQEMMDFLEKNGFLTNSYFASTSIDEVASFISEVDRGKLDFLIDGMVVKVDDVAVRGELGYTDKFPRWAIAYKFDAEEVTTVVKEVLFNVGRTGKVTPLAVLEPVELGGATISRATLNNMGDISRKKVKLGGRVFLRRSNDVIPEIMGNADDEGEIIVAPQACPDCNTALVEDGAHLFCPNSLGCPAQSIGALEHFASKNCMDIEGLSEKTCELLFEKGLVKTVADLYRLKREQLLQLDSFKDKRADNLISAIERSKNASLGSFLHSIGIPNVGKKTAGDLATEFKSVDGLANATKEQLLAVSEVGDIVANSILTFFNANKELISQLKELGLNPVHMEMEGNLSGKRLVLTGSLPTLKRAVATKLIEECGGIVQSGVSKETDFVVAGADAGSKLDKATKLGIKIIDEDELIRICGKIL